MITKDDIKLLVDNFPTRAEFEFKLEQLRAEMATKEELRGVRGLVESVYTEVKNIRLEQSMHLGRHERTEEEIDSLKKRISKFETSPAIPHQIRR